MKFLCTVTFLLSLASVAFAREESILARVTSYWTDEGSNYASTGQRLRAGHCAVDPNEFRTGAKLFSRWRLHRGRHRSGGGNRKAARRCGRTASELKAIVVDRFFETKREAMAWTRMHIQSS